ncbi:MAG: hypothetical protein KDB90_01205 [Planctomycetes bacterium]|nr:hypothetical protein [Planctomycetota bacterium]
MIRFSYDCPPDLQLPFRHFSLEGDNKRGYVLLGWNDEAAGEGFEELADMMLQQWFETLGEALDHCVNEFCITRNDWHAPTVQPPAAHFDRSDRGRRKGESTLLNPNATPKYDKPSGSTS